MKIEVLQDYPGPHGTTRRVGDVYDEFEQTAHTLVLQGRAKPATTYPNKAPGPGQRKPAVPPERPPVGPSERKPVGPSERKPARPDTAARHHTGELESGESVEGTGSHKPGHDGSTPSSASLSKLTNKQLRSMLDAIGAEVPKRALKKDLVRMLRTAQGAK